MSFKEIDVSSLRFSPFEKIGKEWMLITAGTSKSFNTMTASWGGLGVLWNKNVAFAFIRPSRYTYEFCEKEEYFTLSFYGEEYRKALTFCGRNSGRDVDKCVETGLEPVFDEEAPYFRQAALVLVCKKLYAQDMEKSNVLDYSVNDNYAPSEPMHRVYVGEIVKALAKE